MPSVKDMAMGYIQQCKNKLVELKSQAETVNKDIQALSAHIQECEGEVEVEQDGKVATCESKGIPSES